MIRYEGPRGGPGMQEMLYPTSYLKSKGLGKACALITDGRFSGGTSGLSIGHVSPESAEGGLIALIEDGDRIEIDIPNRSLHLAVLEAVLTERQAARQTNGATSGSLDFAAETSRQLYKLMLLSPPALRVAPFGTSRSVNRNFSIRILYSDGDNFPERVMAISRGRFISTH